MNNWLPLLLENQKDPGMSVQCCAVCGRNADKECPCGKIYCSDTCQAEDWSDGHSVEHTNPTTEASLIRVLFLGEEPKSLLATQFVGNKTQENTPTDFRKYYAPKPSDRPIENAADNFALSFMHRIVEMKFGNKRRYPFEKLGEYALLSAMHQAVHELAYYWAKHWSFRRGTIVRLACLIENGFESLLALRVKSRKYNYSRWELFIAAIDPDVEMEDPNADYGNKKVLDHLRENDYLKDVIPDAARLTEVRETFDGMDFTSRVFLQNLQTELEKFKITELKLWTIEEEWKNLISSMALALAWIYGENFEKTDAMDVVKPSTLRIRVAAAIALLQIKTKKFALEINRPSFMDVGRQMNELDTNDVEL